MILNESLFENYEEEWVEVDHKDVMDSDGFYTDYTWYTNGKKHIFMFGDSEIYEPDEDYADWEIEIYPGNEENAMAEAQEWFDSYKGFSQEDNNDNDYLDESILNANNDGNDGVVWEDQEELDENFSPSIPKWLISYLENNPKIKERFSSSMPSSMHLDLANMKYVKIPRNEIPTNGSHPIIKDITKQLVYLLRDASNKNIVYIPGINDDEVINLVDNHKKTKIKNVSIKNLLQYVVAMGYIDGKLKDNYNLNTQKERASLKKGAIERGTGQYQHEIEEYPRNPETGLRDYNADPIVSKSWEQTKNQDKSGYLVNPDKYKNMLDQADMHTYSKQYDRYTRKLLNLKDAIITRLKNMKVDKAIDNSFGQSSLNYAFRYFEDAIKNYERLQNSIEHILSTSMSDEEKNKYIQDEFDGSKHFNSISDLRNNIEKAWGNLAEHDKNVSKLNLDEAIINPDVNSSELQNLAKKHNVDILSPMSDGDLRLSGAGADLMKFYQEASEKGLWEVDPSLYEQKINEDLTMHDFSEFRKIAKEVGLTTAGDLIRFRKEEMQPGESELNAIKRYKNELIDSGVDLSKLINESLNEGVFKDIAIDLEGGEDFISILKRDLIPAKKRLNNLQNMKAKDSGSVSDSQIEDAQKEIDQIEAKLEYLKDNLK